MKRSTKLFLGVAGLYAAIAAVLAVWVAFNVWTYVPPKVEAEYGCPDLYYADFDPTSGGWVCVLSEFESVTHEAGFGQ